MSTAECCGNVADYKCNCTAHQELRQRLNPAPAPKHKASYVGAPAIFALELCCQHINSAFGVYGCYLVGSALDCPDWRDVDVRFIMEDKEFSSLFPNANTVNANWEHDPRWLLLTTCITGWLRHTTGLPIDFQFQPQTFANKQHNKTRSALGLRVSKSVPPLAEEGEKPSGLDPTR